MFCCVFGAMFNWLFKELAQLDLLLIQKKQQRQQ